MTYYFDNSGASSGPVSKEELKGKISKDTLIWFEGQKDWVKASEVDDLKDLFFETPPPLPKKDKVIKVEASIKKESKEILTEKNQVQIATEIKNIFLLAVVAALIGLFTFVIKQASDEKYNKYNSLLNGFKSYDNEYSNMLHNQYPLTGDGEQAKIDKWFSENRNRKDSLVSLSRDYGCFRESSSLGFSIPDTDSIISCLKYRVDDINDEAISIAKRWAIISLLILIIGRYVFFASKWVAKKSN